ncbi:hypothetical protein [Rhizobium sp. EC-SD404]|uniref:hypothetical protein n=1 Tax=Rhizobium sp. EC-SD404 TaxID=2038389 RepID=UPI001255BDBF|nr:hypothetical protein [Rhizobium sp. EC-SD404]VVT34339.1 hypothetical protein RHIZ404_90014 [Rhizobium sp. EC-SD404]
MAESDVQRSLGRLEGKLDAFIETQREHERTSAESRKRVYEKLENVESTLNHIDGRVGRAERVIT